MIEANPVLQEDHCRGMILATYPLYYIAFDNTLAAGPVPTLFSEKPEESLAGLKKSPEHAFRCLQALVSRLLTRGELTRLVD